MSEQTSYELNFESTTSITALKQQISSLYGIDPSLIYAGTPEGLDTYSGPEIEVLITTPLKHNTPFECLLQAGQTLATATGNLSELALATVLCKNMQIRAIVDDNGLSYLSWMLVTPDGWHGRVIMDEEALDEGLLVIDYALQPVPSDPDIRVEEPPYWQSGWYRDGKIPESGYELPA